MRLVASFAAVALLWAQSSPSWGRASIDSARSVIPAYITSPVSQPSTRLPYFAVLRLTGLEPNTTYRYVSRMDNSTTPPTNLNINQGAGNPILYNSSTNTWSLTSTPSLDNPGGYGTITTDGNGEAILFFGLQPTSNPRFRTDGGNKVYIKVFLRSDSPPIDSAYVIGDKTPIQPLALRSNCPSQDTCGSFLYDSSLAAAKKLVFLYSGYGAHHLGERPITGAIVENAGISWGTSQLSSYTTHVSGRPQRYGTILPNNLPGGVRAIHYWDQGWLPCENAIYDLDAIWPGSGISTVNPNNGPAAVGLLNSPTYPLLPKPTSNSCISPTINPSTGNIHVGYLLMPTYGFSYGFSVRLFPFSSCVQPTDLPVSITLPDSASPMSPYYLYPLCDRDAFATIVDSIQGQWIVQGDCDPCVYYFGGEGTFYWRCFRGEGGFRVQNFSYYGTPNPFGPGYYSTASTTLLPLRVPKKVEWDSSTLPSSPVQAGAAFTLTAMLRDSLTPARWSSSTPNFSTCSGSVTLHLLDANNTPVSSFNGYVSSSPSWWLARADFSGFWPTTPGTYKLVISPIQLNCNCGTFGNLNWAGSDTVTVVVDVSSGIAVHTEAEAWIVALPQAEGQLFLYNAQGQLLWQAPAEARTRIPRYTLPAGLYTLVWQGKGGVSVRKLLQP